MALKEVGKLDAHDGRCKVDGLAEAYLLYAKNSTRSYEWVEIVWRCHLKPFFGGKLAARVTTDDLQEYIGERLEAGAATSTINRELTVLHAMFKQGSESTPPKVLQVPRFPKMLKEPKARQGFLTDEEYARLKSELKLPALRALLSVGYTFGFRKSELLGLKVSQVDLKARTLSLLEGETKSGEGRKVVMTSEVLALISECVKGKLATDKVFTRQDGSPVRDFRGAWAGATKKAGVPGLLVHDLRRAACRNMVRAGISQLIARGISGHKTSYIFDRYNITSDADLNEAARKMEARASANAQQ